MKKFQYSQLPPPFQEQGKPFPTLNTRRSIGSIGDHMAFFLTLMSWNWNTWSFSGTRWLPASLPSPLRSQGFSIQQNSLFKFRLEARAPTRKRLINSRFACLRMQRQPHALPKKSQLQSRKIRSELENTSRTDQLGKLDNLSRLGSRT